LDHWPSRALERPYRDRECENFNPWSEIIHDITGHSNPDYI